MNHKGDTLIKLQAIVEEMSPHANTRSEYQVLCSLKLMAKMAESWAEDCLKADFKVIADKELARSLQVKAERIRLAAKEMMDTLELLILED